MNARARRAISWRKCRCDIRDLYLIWLRSGQFHRASGRTLPGSGSNRSRFLAGHVAQGARAPAARHIPRGDIASWSAPPRTDLLFANASFQWIPNHPRVLRRLLEALPSGSVLAVQMPDNTREPSHVLQREVAANGPWANNPGIMAAPRGDLSSPEEYYDLLGPVCSRIDSGTASTIT